MKDQPSEWNSLASEWEAYDNFGYPKEWSKAERAWYRRTFEVPSDMRGSRAFLRFDAVNFRSEAK